MRHLLTHPDYVIVKPYIRKPRRRRGIDVEAMPPRVLAIALAITADCATCGAPIHPIRERRDYDVRDRRLASTGPLFYSGTCPTTVSARCSKGSAASADMDRMIAALDGPDPGRRRVGLFDQ